MNEEKLKVVNVLGKGVKVRQHLSGAVSRNFSAI